MSPLPADPGSAPLRVIVADDSRTARALLVGVLESDPGIRVVAQAADGAEALELTRRHRPAVLVMDVEMPNMDGFEATKRIMIEEPTPIVVVSARYDTGQVEMGLRALRAGALTILPKPAGPASPDFEAQAARMTALVKALSQVKVVRQRSARPDGPAAQREGRCAPRDTAGRRGDGAIAVIGVAASTGGPAALYRFLELLPRTLDVPVVVVQHIAEGFVPGLVRWLGGATVLPICVAADGQHLTGGHVHVAPDNRNVEVAEDRIRLSPESPLSRFCPSADVLFASLADAYGPRSAAVVLTGMGTDGLEGARRVRDRGGLVLAQDAGSSVVYGMPRAVADAGIADAVGPIDDLVERIVPLARTKGRQR